MTFEKLKKRFQGRRASKNFLWREFFLIRDKIEFMKSDFQDLMTKLFKEPIKMEIKEVSSSKIKNNIGKYYYFGEFGYFHFSVMGGLSVYFNKYPNHKLEILTYENYGRLLELAFPENVKAYYPDYKFEEKYRQCHEYHDRPFRVATKREGFKKNVARELTIPLKWIPRIQFDDISDEAFFHMLKPLEFEVKKKTGRLVCVFPRFRRTSTDRNLGKEEWDKIINLLLKLKYKIVVLGLSEESVDLKNKNLIYPKDIYEQIFYLNNAALYVSPFSGLQHFAENCGCDIFIILHPEPAHAYIFDKHRKFNPFNTKIYSFREDEDYLKELEKVLSKKSK